MSLYFIFVQGRSPKIEAHSASSVYNIIKKQKRRTGGSTSSLTTRPRRTSAQAQQNNHPNNTDRHNDSLRAYARGELRQRRPLTDVIPVTVKAEKEFIFCFDRVDRAATHYCS